MPEAPSDTPAGAAPPLEAGAPAGGGTAARGRLVRRTDNKVIAGVASGIAAYLGIEPILVRIAFVVLTVFGGLGALLYVIGWLLIPPAGAAESIGLAAARRPAGLRTYVGIALVILAIGILASAFSDPAVIWAVALIAFGIYLFQQGQERPPPPPGPPASPATAAPDATAPPTAPPAGPPPWSAATAPTEPRTWEPPGPAGPPAWGPPPAWQAERPPSPPRRSERRRAFLGPLTFGVALVVTGLATVLDNLGVVELTLGRALALFLTVIGLGLLVGGWWGRAWGLIPVGLLLIPVVAVASLADSEPLSGGFGERLWQPQTPAEVRPLYRLAGGELIVDLRRVRFGPGSTPVEASLAAGRLLVVVPDEVTADVRGRAGLGNLDLFESGDEDWGVQVDSSVTQPPTKAPKAGAAPTVRLDLHVGYGLVEVRRASDPRPLSQVGWSGDVAPPTTTTEVIP
ncbi:MAG TPA: PspC domain-containing protein [Actinomycetota bacterium]|nr:PspC domain-containing protein [Actinomycetota bacterium]